MVPGTRCVEGRINGIMILSPKSQDGHEPECAPRKTAAEKIWRLAQPGVGFVIWGSRTASPASSNPPREKLSAELSAIPLLRGSVPCKPAWLRGLLQYRHGDSNPGFRRERAAS